MKIVALIALLSVFPLLFIYSERIKDTNDINYIGTNVPLVEEIK